MVFQGSLARGLTADNIRKENNVPIRLTFTPPMNNFSPFINDFISLPLRFHEVAHELGVEDRITMAIAGIRSIH